MREELTTLGIEALRNGLEEMDHQLKASTEEGLDTIVEAVWEAIEILSGNGRYPYRFIDREKMW